ncbi:hypothetical protein RB195_004569 [Necator americanus]
MMREAGLGMPSGTNVTWIQTFLYDFGFGEIDLPHNWTRIRIWGYDKEGVELMHTSGRLLWEQNLPTDFDRPWDLRGPFVVTKILRRHQRFCEKFLDDRRFLQYMSHKTDLVVLDHLLQECMGGLAFLLNASVVQYSNWPIADGYITSLNVPANPSAIPKTGTPHSCLGMSFFERLTNLLFHWNIIAARYIQKYWLYRMFQGKSFAKVDLMTAEAQRTIYAGRSEFLFEVVRPINNRVKHFASNIQVKPNEFVTVIPEMCGNRTADEAPCGGLSRSLSVGNKWNYSTVLHSTIEYSSSRCLTNHTSQCVRRTHLYKDVDRSLAKKRFDRISLKFPELDWPSLTKEKFIVVTFGSLAMAENMPLNFAQKLIDTFSHSPFKVIWQTNSDPASLLWNRNVTIPKNVVLTRWAPIKEMLAHPNLQYLICHGGINTINELLLFGVPWIGVYLQGDQASNVKRLTDLGVAAMITVRSIAEGKLLPTMRLFEKNLESHWKRASQLSSMLETYRGLHNQEQDFWISWTIRHGRKLRGRNLFRMNYIGDDENLFWFALAFIMFMLFCVTCV